MGSTIVNGITVHRDNVTYKFGNTTVNCIFPDPYPSIEEQNRMLTACFRVDEKAMLRMERELDKQSKKGA